MAGEALNCCDGLLSTIGLANIEYEADTGMRESGGSSGFVDKVQLGFGVVDEPGRKEHQGAGVVELVVRESANEADAPAAEVLENPVV